MAEKVSEFEPKNKHSAAFSRERVRNSHSPNFEMNISRQENSQSIQTLLSGKQPLNSPSHLKRELSAYSFALFCVRLPASLERCVSANQYVVAIKVVEPCTIVNSSIYQQPAARFKISIFFVS